MYMEDCLGGSARRGKDRILRVKGIEVHAWMPVRIAQWNPQTLSERRGKRRGAWEDVEG
jgi:hypothetical protein